MVGLALLMSSCAVPDPLFLQNAGAVKNVDYPANKIVGTWVHVSIRPVQLNSEMMEGKAYLYLAAGGKGKKREVVINRANNGRFSAEAPLTWSYQGNNWWTIHLPGTAAFRVTESHLIQMGGGPHRGPRDVRVRYYKGDLYDFDHSRILVPADAKSVAELANRMRSQTPTYRIETQ